MEPKLALRIKVEIVFLIDAFERNKFYNTSEITKLMEEMTDRAMNKGKAKAKEAYEDQVAQSLKNGAGAAHKRTAIDHALPPLRFTFREKDKQGEVQYVTDPIRLPASTRAVGVEPGALTTNLSRTMLLNTSWPCEPITLMLRKKLLIR